MARTNAIATDPVLFYRTDGILEEIPLQQIYFEGGAIKTDRVTGPNDALLPKWLEFLAARGDLKPSPEAPVATALNATAQRAGSASNHITVRIEPSANTNEVKVTVTQIDVYLLLTRANLDARLGKGAAKGSEDGLVKVKTNPANAAEPDGTVSFDPGPPPIWTIAGAGNQKITLELRDTATANLDKVTTTVTVSDVTPAPGGPTFTLRVESKASVDAVAFGATFPTAKLGELSYLVTFEQPAGAVAPFALPRPATIALGGGADQIAATNATARLLAKD